MKKDPESDEEDKTHCLSPTSTVRSSRGGGGIDVDDFEHLDELAVYKGVDLCLSGSCRDGDDDGEPKSFDFEGRTEVDEEGVGEEVGKDGGGGAAVIGGDAIDSIERPLPPAPTFWGRRGRTLLAVAAVVAVIAAAAVTTVRVLSPNRKDEAGPTTTVELPGLESEEVGTDPPTASPTAAPTIKPRWDVIFNSIETNFGPNSSHDIVLSYDVGIDQPYSSQVYARDCLTPVEGIVLDLSADRAPKSIHLDTLTLNYKLDKRDLRGSNIWDDAAEQIRMCQVVQLVFPSEEEGFPDWVITEDKRTFDIDLIMLATFGGGGGGGGLDLTVQLAPGEEDGGNATARW